eukprot:482917_1
MTDKDKKNQNLHCMGCHIELADDHTGITCTQSHHICPECSVNFVHEVLEAPSDHIPLQCMICKQTIVRETFERQLNDQQMQTFLLYNIQYNPKSYLADNEMVACCPFCEYFEINTKAAGRLLFLCKRYGCMKSSCFWCKKLIKDNGIDEEDEGDDEKNYNMDQDDVETHFECARLAPIKKKWDEAISGGQTQPCPKCGLAGRKNNACTHMTCVKCRCQWCYVCGLSLDKLNKQQGIDDIMGHNVNWKKNLHRCPMYLDNITEVDQRWPDNDSEACVAFFHRLKTMQLLKRVVEELGDEPFAALCKKYNVAEICGFDMKEVMEGDHRFIIRQEINNDDDESEEDWFFGIGDDDDDDDESD